MHAASECRHETNASSCGAPRTPECRLNPTWQRYAHRESPLCAAARSHVRPDQEYIQTLNPKARNAALLVLEGREQSSRRSTSNQIPESADQDDDPLIFRNAGIRAALKHPGRETPPPEGTRYRYRFAREATDPA